MPKIIKTIPKDEINSVNGEFEIKNSNNPANK